ncbi:MAG: hypothetical protein GEV13_16435 [Rhodospirillales bacterium]|nr:hypothetical protein [Rhodospirillales bacterium]
MRQLFRRGVVTIATGIVGALVVWSSAMAQGEPPGRVGRLAFIDGTVSFHDDEQSAWTPAVVNTPLTTGDGLWTEPNARSEISLAGTRIRMEGATQLDMLALDDTQTRLQLAQGRIDVKTLAMDARQPYEIVTPRGTIRLLQQGDYYVEAGSTEDPTRLGVRSGAAQIQALNGQVLAVRANEVAEVTGDGAAPLLRTIRTAPPAPPAYWASRDRQVVYDPPRYLSVGVTGYEDLNAYGDWINDGSYGRVWVPRAVPSGWAPYRTGHWAYVRPWGWTWIDEQPWGFAPYHYGRWATRNDRWVWVPPQRDVRPVYAPALVAFVGGVELAVTLGNQSAAPVGWFPLGPREVYVPPYTTDREYYRRLNRSARIEDRILEDRWQRTQRREAYLATRDQAMMNQRFATVVPTAAFVRSQPVMRSALQVRPQAIAAAPVAPVAAPPAPTASIKSATAAPATPLPKAATTPAPPPVDPKAEADVKAKADAELKTANVPVAKTPIADMPTLAKPIATEKPAAPGPKVATTQPRTATDDKSRQAAPALAPRQGAAPPELKGAVTPTQPAQPGGPPRQQQAKPQPQARPDAPKPAEPPKQQAAPRPQATPPVSPPRQARPADAPKPQATPQSQPQQAKPAEAPRRPATPQAAPAPQAKPQQPQAAPPAPRAPAPRQQQGRARPVEPPRQQAAPQPQQARPAPPQQQQQQQQQQQRAAPQPQPKAPEQAQSRPAPQPKRDDNKKGDRK